VNSVGKRVLSALPVISSVNYGRLIVSADGARHRICAMCTKEYWSVYNQKRRHGMARPKAATPAAHIRSILRFFNDAPLELADVAFELTRATLAERRARKKAATPAKPAKPTTAAATANTTAILPTALGKVVLDMRDGPAAPAPSAPSAPPTTQSPAAQVARPANKARVQPKKKKPAAAAAAVGKKRGAARPIGNSIATPETATEGEGLPEQHPDEELNEGPPTPMW